MASYLDSHVHLADPAFDADREEVIVRARATGAVALLCIGESLQAAARSSAIAAAHPEYVYWTAGIHPHAAASFDPVQDPRAIRDHLAHGAVAVGECGLDYHYDHSPRELQRRAFAQQLAIAGETGRPVVVHTREAVDDTRAMVREAGAAGIIGVLHCFGGPVQLAEEALAAGWYLSFSGIVTFKRWNDDALIRLVPDDRILVETDAPYLAPVPHRGRRNEPAYATLTLARLGQARAQAASDLGELTIENARRLFGLASAVTPD